VRPGCAVPGRTAHQAAHTTNATMISNVAATRA